MAGVVLSKSRRSPPLRQADAACGGSVQEHRWSKCQAAAHIGTHSVQRSSSKHVLCRMAPGMTAAAAIWLGLLFCNPAVALVPRSSNGWTAKSSHIQQSSQHAAASSATASAAQPAYPAIHASSGPAQQSHQQQRRLSAVLRSAAAIAASAGAAKLPQIQIPQPPPGADIPVEPLVPLYSPDQLRLRLPPIAGALPDGQIISLMEQMQQAEALHTTLSSEQLQYANPLLGRQGVLKLPEKTLPEHYPEGYVAICAIVKNQHKDLREWIEYHKWIGVSKIYIYDNNSTVTLVYGLQEYSCNLAQQLASVHHRLLLHQQ